MPQSDRQVSRFNLTDDLNSYYRGSIVTVNVKGENLPVYIEGFHNNDGEIKAHARHLNKAKDGWAGTIQIPYEGLDFVLPPLGLVKYGKYWFHLHRHPARRMRKGYNEETIGWSAVGDHGYGLDVGVTDHRIVTQVWFGAEERITHNIVVIGKEVFYTTDHVANVSDTGEVILIPEREKLGEFVCKALANNWESVTSKTSVRTLPSSVPTP